jgi:hypothetical protein
MVEMYGLQREMSKGNVDRKAALAGHAESACPGQPNDSAAMLPFIYSTRSASAMT